MAVSSVSTAGNNSSSAVVSKSGSSSGTTSKSTTSTIASTLSKLDSKIQEINKLPIKEVVSLAKDLRSVITKTVSGLSGSSATSSTSTKSKSSSASKSSSSSSSKSKTSGNNASAFMTDAEKVFSFGSSFEDIKTFMTKAFDKNNYKDVDVTTRSFMLQQFSEQRSMQLSAMSNFMKTSHEAAMSVIRNFRS